jgi:hypothetical protein
VTEGNSATGSDSSTCLTAAKEIRQALIGSRTPLFGPFYTKAPSLDGRPFGIISKKSQTSNVMRHVFNVTFYAFRTPATAT